MINAEAAELLGVSKRQLQRLHKPTSMGQCSTWRRATVAWRPTTQSMLPSLPARLLTLGQSHDFSMETGTTQLLSLTATELLYSNSRHSMLR